MKKILLIVFFVLGVSLGFSIKVEAAVDGSGSSTNPYIVKSEDDLRWAVSKAVSNGWTYIVLENDVTISNTLKISKGKIDIRARGKDRSINKSIYWTDRVNDVNAPAKMIKVENTAELVLGSAGNVLTINGFKEKLRDRENNDVLCIEASAKATLGEKSVVKDCRNLKMNDESAPIRVYGYLNVYGEIKNCEGLNGGAIKCIGGYVNLEKNAFIHNCYSATEGGAIYLKNKGTLYMEPGSVISDNRSFEEGGGIFCTYESEARIFGGIIENNNSGKSAGGVFSGYGSTLILGRSNSAPIIKNNISKSFGGAIRCNGGSVDGGGKTIINNCEIVGNTASSYGGGISVGGANGKYESSLSINQLNMHTNKADYGGGLHIESVVKGTNGSLIEIKNTGIYNNTSISGAGVFNQASIDLIKTSIKSNTASNKGGGIYNYSGAITKMFSGSINENVAKLGGGIYQAGTLQLGEVGFINTSNEVYLPANHHIDIIKKMDKGSGLLALIETEIKAPGTIVVNVNYPGGDGESELYYVGTGDSEKNGDNVTKKFKTTDNIVLRPGTKVEGILNSKYIVLSKKYEISYISNSLDAVLNMPKDQIGFHYEKSTLSSNALIREGFIFDVSKSWNSAASGYGKVYQRGGSIVVKSNLKLYAIWNEIPISKLTMQTRDRYYYVGQKIVLNKKEVTSKVEVKNDAGTNVTYEVVVTSIENNSGKVIAEGYDIKVEDYLSTDKSGIYVLHVKSSSYRGDVSVTGELKVYVLDARDNKVEVRFISEEFIETVAPWSVWKEEKYDELSKSLSRYDNGIYNLDLTKENLNEAKKRVKSASYKISAAVVKREKRRLFYTG